MKTTNDDAVRTLCRRLLLTDFVTELRAAVHNSADGKRLTVDPVLLRAHLARLLREIGCIDEARAEGEAVLAALKTYPLAPNQTLADNPAALEIRAAAVEATGDDRKASAIYARRVELQLKMNGDFDPQHDRLASRLVGGPCLCPVPVANSEAASTIAELEKYLGNPSAANAERRAPSGRLAFSWHSSSMVRASPSSPNLTGRRSRPSPSWTQPPPPATPASNDPASQEPDFSGQRDCPGRVK